MDRQQHLTGHPAADLLCTQRQSLAAWYAEPATARELSGLQQAAEAGLRVRLCRGRSSFRPQLLQLVCQHLNGSDIEPGYRRLLATLRDAYDMALLELVYGQLLISRKLQTATAHLESGFLQAARYLDSADYFRLVRRHELLGYLVLSENPAGPQPLDALLSEAAVIRRLRANDRRHYVNAHHDTVG